MIKSINQYQTFSKDCPKSKKILFKTEFYKNFTFRLCSGLGWDIDGDILAVIASGSSQLFLWDANSRRQQVIDVGLRDSMSWIGWTKTGTVLAAATVRGNLAIYNHHTSKYDIIFIFC